MIHLHPTKLIAVPVPEDANRFHRKYNELWYDDLGNEDYEHIGFKFKILGTATKDTIDFDPSVIGMTEAEVRSLLTANDALFENPYGEHEPLKTSKKYLRESWQTAQSKVNKKYVILEKL